MACPARPQIFVDVGPAVVAGVEVHRLLWQTVARKARHGWLRLDRGLRRSGGARPGVDVGLAEGAGDRDAMAPVEDVVAVWPLDDRDRLERKAFAAGAGDVLPAGRDPVGRRPEGSVEVGRGIHGADDVVERDRPQAHWPPADCGDLAEVARVRSRRTASGEPAGGVRLEVVPASAQEVCVRVLYHHHHRPAIPANAMSMTRSAKWAVSGA